jgi:hypothetical protein
MGERAEEHGNFVYVANRITNTNCAYEGAEAFSTVVQFYLKYI